MDKQTQSQLELFSQSGEYSNNSQSTKKSFWAFIWGYEKTIFVIIGFMLTGIIAFSIGVEKGKRTTALNATMQVAAGLPTQQPLINRQAVVQPIAANQPIVNKIAAVQPAAPVAAKETLVTQPNQLSGQYTIQIASFKTRDSAQREFASLKAKGYSPFLVTKNGIMVLYAGNFTNKAQAKSLLSQLQKRYKDCFIRRL